MGFIYKFIVRLLLIGLAFWAIDTYVFVEQFSVTPATYFGYGVVAVIFSLVNTILKPILKIITLPLRILTFGLFSFVLNAGLLWLVQQILEVSNFGVTMSVADLLTYVLLGLIMAIIAVIAP